MIALSVVQLLFTATCK